MKLEPCTQFNNKGVFNLRSLSSNNLLIQSVYCQIEKSSKTVIEQHFCSVEIDHSLIPANI